MVVEWRDDPCREIRRAPAIDQFEHGVEIDPAVAREPTGHAGSESGGKEPAAAPVDDGAELRASVE